MGSGASLYQFGSDFSKTNLHTIDMATAQFSAGETGGEPGTVLLAYVDGYRSHGDEFDRSIIADMQELGYNLSGINAGIMDRIFLPPTAPQNIIALSVSDSDIGIDVHQINMSQGLFRALAVVVALNRARFSKAKTLVLIDDIGEGLDFERASKMISVAVNHAQDDSIQLLMTSNDRFVMNSVPLEYWIVLQRKKQRVKSYSIRNSTSTFENFKYLGLSNFDFFANESYH
jgi:hypothetical protein